MMNTMTLEKHDLNPPPWYKQFWPWFLISLPLSAVIAGIATIMIAMHKPDGLVADDYYKQGLAINRQLASEEMARQLDIVVQLDIADGQINLSLDGKMPLPEKLTVEFVHPTLASEDKSITLLRDQDNHYQGRFDSLAPVNWHIKIIPEKDHWSLSGRYNPTSTSKLTLKAI